MKDTPIVLVPSDVAQVTDTGTPARYSPLTDGLPRSGIKDSTYTRITGGPHAGKLRHRTSKGKIVALYEGDKEIDPDDYSVSTCGTRVTIFVPHTRTSSTAVTVDGTTTWSTTCSTDAVAYAPANRKERRTQQSLARRGKRAKPKASYVK